MPVSVKNRNTLTESLGTSNHSKLASQHWHLGTRWTLNGCLFTESEEFATVLWWLKLTHYPMLLNKDCEHEQGIVDNKGQLNIRQWEKTGSAATGHVWFTDCESLFAHLVSHNTKHVDNKRLAIDLPALKPLIWTTVVTVMKKSMDRKVIIHICDAVRMFDEDNELLTIN